MTDREIMLRALDALEIAEVDGNCCYEATELLRTRLAQPEPEDDYIASIIACREVLDAQPVPPRTEPVQEPVSMRLPKAGDKVICLEDDSLATVVSLTAGGSPDIVFSDGSRGTYLLKEFAELFGYATSHAAQPEQAPPCPTCEALARTVMLDQTSHDTQRQWVGLTDDEMQALWDRYAHMEMMRAIEAKLKEKNT